MMDQLTNKYARGFGISLIIMMLFNAVLTVTKEAYEPLIKGMAAISGHHWITHGIIVVVLFFILGFVFSGAQTEKSSWASARRVTICAILSAAIGAILIGGFYLIE
jgi:protein-S-isoprenylcysteine O-methyltransferase Ste14